MVETLVNTGKVQITCFCLISIGDSYTSANFPVIVYFSRQQTATIYAGPNECAARLLIIYLEGEICNWQNVYMVKYWGGEVSRYSIHF